MNNNKQHLVKGQMANYLGKQLIYRANDLVKYYAVELVDNSP